MAQRTKDEIIIFQNQSHLVHKYFESCGYCPTLLEIALATDVMVDFAMKGPTKEVLTRFEKMQAHIDSAKKILNKK
jgi:hypothetical protein